MAAVKGVSHADNVARRDRYIELRQAGMSCARACDEVGLVMGEPTARRYEHWFQAVSKGQEIVVRPPGRQATPQLP